MFARFWFFRCSFEEIALKCIVEDEHEGTTGSSDDVGKRSLEEGKWTFFSCDDNEAVQGALVYHIFGSSSRLHHKASSDGIEWVGNNTSGYSNDLSDSPLHEHVSTLEELFLCGIIHSEVSSTVEDNSCD